MAETIVMPTTEEINTLEASVVTLTSELEAASGALAQVGRKGNPNDIGAAYKAWETATKGLATATNKLAASKNLIANAGRLAARDNAEKAVNAFLAESIEVLAAFELGCTRIDIVRTEGVYVVNVASGLIVPRVARAKGAKSESTGEGKGRITWIYNGSEYTSRQLLEQFGGVEGAAAIRLATKNADDPESWVNKTQANGKGYSFGPGFHSEVVALADKIGATRQDA